MGITHDVIPRATYRIQLSARFGFEDAAGIAPYVKALGASHLYCSPYLQATPGSSHGYDVVDPLHLSRELGGAAGHTSMVESLRREDLGHLLDIVPNHMAAHPDNPWWWDVLENGPASRWAGFFDIDWAGDDTQSHLKVLVPILGDHYGRVLERGELALQRIDSRFVLTYHEHRIPISLPTLSDTLSAASRACGRPSLAALAEALDRLPPSGGADAPASEAVDRRQELHERFRSLLEGDGDVARAIDQVLEDLNTDPDRLDQLLGAQNYRLAYWRVANEEIDYRRFFNIETLVGVRVEDPDVFTETHRLILDLVRDGTVSGLRVDHIDGLRDPRTYLERLGETTIDSYLVVEKILEPGEALDRRWPVAGTTGYDFLDRVNQLFVDTSNETAFDEIYTSFTGEPSDYAAIVLTAKRGIMRDQLSAEVHRLTGLLAEVAARDRRHRDHTRRDLREALVELIAGYDVYRTYVEPGGAAGDTDRARVARAVAAAKDHHPDPELIDLLGRLACGDERESAAARELTQRLQQVTSPVMAKGVEDTAFYRYNRLVSLNEVGGDPGSFGRPIDSFHQATSSVAGDWPHTMLTLTTHDTKRSADVRARLNVLSELPGPWREMVETWAGSNEKHRSDGWPDRNTEYLLYQTLIGAWPLDTARAIEYMNKATREAGVHTSWVEPQRGFEEATTRFVTAVLDDPSFTTSLDSFLEDHHLVERGRRNSLSQVALAMTSPGVPDVYQGDELWNLSLVDPDNRRPVDFALRREALRSLRGPAPALADDTIGVTKLRVLHTLLRHRTLDPELYQTASYDPVEVSGPSAAEIVAFRRGPVMTIAAVRSKPRLSGTIALPATGGTDLLSARVFAGGPIRLDELLSDLPVAVLTEGPR